ncbi:MAG: flagellar FliJ family protein [Desulfobulbaceae bacterium]|nr:flagellar FliJ family protein [Desulfobulbaceae bacterium]MCK5437047.1 flagellar FliJ family protein [Desulfobulbaceae bacterium]MCK5543870.1 flagellar FliJ family protein [Desulfobulbaceae bacterium]
MAYHFRLETVLTYRRNLEEQAQLRLAGEQMILDNHFRRLGELEESRIRIADELEERKKQRMTFPRFRFYQNLFENNEREAKRRNSMIESQRQIVETARQELEERIRDRKIMENVRTRDYENFQKESLRQEHNESDELALLRYGRV